MERLADGPVICAEGYLFELERRGYLQAGAFVPEVVSDHPDVVRQLHQDFVHAGSDVVEALTYYAHREKMRLIGREDELEPMNRQALRIAKDVAAETGALVAGNICNTNIYDPDDAAGQAKIRDLYAEQMEWIVDEGVDFVIAETFPWQGEAELALDAIKQSGLPAVVTYAIHRDGLTREGNTPAQACKTLEDQGAAVVGLNCTRGPETMLPILQEIAALGLARRVVWFIDIGVADIAGDQGPGLGRDIFGDAQRLPVHWLQLVLAPNQPHLLPMGVIGQGLDHVRPRMHKVLV